MLEHKVGEKYKAAVQGQKALFIWQKYKEGPIEDGIWWVEIQGGISLGRNTRSEGSIWRGPPNVSLMGTPCTATHSRAPHAWYFQL